MSNQKKLGIENLILVVLFIVGLMNIAGQVFEKGKKPNWKELGGLLPFLMQVTSVFRALFDAGQEALDLDHEEKEELNSAIARKLDLPNDKTEVLTEMSIALLLNIFLFILKVRSLLKGDETTLSISDLLEEPKG